jgi:hypothetical protein
MCRFFCCIDLRKSGRVALALSVYLDESSGEYPYLASGWAAKSEGWDSVSDRWQRVLDAAPRIGYFKLNDALGLKGPFAGWSERDRDAKLISLAQTIPHDGTVFGIGCHVRRDDFEKYKSRISRELYRDPYYFAVGSAMVFAAAGENQIVGVDKIDFILDRSKAAERMRSLFYETIKPFFPKLGECLALDDKTVLPLQAADLSAGVLRQLYEPKPRTIPGTYALKGLFSGVHEIRPKGIEDFIASGILPGRASST